MLFYSASAIALIFVISGMLIYRLGLSDAVKIKKGAFVGGLFKGEKKNEVEDWQSIINYDHRKS